MSSSAPNPSAGTREMKNPNPKPNWILPYKTQMRQELYIIGKKLGRGQFGVGLRQGPPQLMVSGLAKAEKTPKCLYLRNLHLWPWFHVYVSQDLEREPPEVVDVRVPMRFTWSEGGD